MRYDHLKLAIYVMIAFAALKLALYGQELFLGILK